MFLRQPINANDYFMIITLIGPTINRSDASLKSRWYPGGVKYRAPCFGCYKPGGIFYAIESNICILFNDICKICQLQVCMMCDHFRQSAEWTFALDNLNLG